MSELPLEDLSGNKPYVFPQPGYLSVEQYARLKGIPKETMFGYFRGEKMKGSYFVDRKGYKNVDAEKADKCMAQPSIREQMNRKKLEKDESTDGPNNAHQYTQARAANEVIKVQLAQLELAELKGSLVKVDDVKRERFLFARAIRDQLLNIPERNAAILAAESDPRTVSDLLMAEIRGALRAVEEELKNLAE